MKDIAQKITNDPEIKAFMHENHLELDQYLLPFYAFLSKKKLCHECQGLTDCKQTIIGHKPVLEYDKHQVIISYQPCTWKEKDLVEVKKRNNLKLISCTFKNYNFDDVFQNSKRKTIMSRIKQIYEKVKNNEPTKGLYVYGSYGTGKSYLLAFLAKRLSDINKKVIFAYYPDLVRQIKSSIGSGDLEDIIEELKDVDVLILDDFGGEQNSDFIRDEVLGAILQERMTRNLLTCMTSNLSPTTLRDHVSNGSREIDVVKASRIYERINTLMDFVSLEDKNYR